MKYIEPVCGATLLALTRDNRLVYLNHYPDDDVAVVDDSADYVVTWDEPVFGRSEYHLINQSGECIDRSQTLRELLEHCVETEPLVQSFAIPIWTTPVLVVDNTGKLLCWEFDRPNVRTTSEAAYIVWDDCRGYAIIALGSMCSVEYCADLQTVSRCVAHLQIAR